MINWLAESNHQARKIIQIIYSAPRKFIHGMKLSKIPFNSDLKDLQI